MANSAGNERVRRNIRDLARRMADELGITVQAADDSIRSLGRIVVDELRRGATVGIVGFGSFELGVRQPRTVRHPGTGQGIALSVRKRVIFRPSRGVTAGLNDAQHDKSPSVPMKMRHQPP